MNVDIFKVSKLRVIDSSKLVSKLSEEEKINAINKYDNNMYNFYVQVEFKNGFYSVVANEDYYYVCEVKGIKEINIGINHSDTKLVIENIKTRIKKEIFSYTMVM